MCITASIQLIVITDVRTTSSGITIPPMKVGATGIALLGVYGTLVVKCCVWVSCVVISTLLTVEVANSEILCAVPLYTSDDCDDGVSGEYVDTVEQFMGITVSLSSKPQHVSSSLVQIVQSLLLVNVILMSDGVSESFTSTVHQLKFPAVIVSLSI